MKTGQDQSKEQDFPQQHHLLLHVNCECRTEEMMMVAVAGMCEDYADVGLYTFPLPTADGADEWAWSHN